MAVAMLPRMVAVVVLVTLMCALVVGQVPAAGGAPVCDLVDQDVMNACFKSFEEGMKNAIADRRFSVGKVIKVGVNCCIAFGGHSGLCKMRRRGRLRAKVPRTMCNASEKRPASSCMQDL
uniref:Prolamin-like domain-containing protein n=2 Tax=Aegilops tauschii TaxID=37682 RepID=A0A453D9I5_AEGTS